ncbi:MAG: HAMP domain-containing histidine kinase [Deltaproteobacteria bacterium]|nr:HAMP domain-containing histidine kinase [Deltaproteobacteria bacterium]
MSLYTLEPAEWGGTSPSDHKADSRRTFPLGILLEKARWFIRMRWVVVLSLLSFGLLSHLAESQLQALGVIPGKIWPIAIAAVLVLGNSFVALAVRRPQRSLSLPVNLWVQIILDMACIGVVIHFVGVFSFAPSFYFLHIALACIFFDLWASFGVLLLALASYTLCIYVELSGWVEPAALMLSWQQEARVEMSGWSIVTMSAGYALIMLALWYIVSRMSVRLREHERSVVQAAKKVLRLQEDRDKYAVQMTHQLKAPLDAMRSIMMLITEGYVEPVSGDIRKRLLEVDKQAEGLGELILDVLRLYNLQKAAGRPIEPVDIDLGERIRAAVVDLKQMADKRRVRVNLDVGELSIKGVPLQIDLLLHNLLSNAITYSFSEGEVHVVGGQDEANGRIFLEVRDQGIGIAAEKIPKIFEEYYHTEEAFKHNSTSTGIGLAIVKKIAETHGLKIQVESEVGKGTCFRILFPRRLPQLPPDHDRSCPICE